MKYLKYFEQASAYEAYKNGSEFVLPNVSYIVELAHLPAGDPRKSVMFNPYVAPASPNVVCTYNVTDISQEISILHSYGLPYMTNMIVDGVEMEAETYYQFDTVGNHVVEFVLDDPTTMGESTFWYCTELTSVIIPNSVTTIPYYAFDGCSSLTSINIPDSVTTIESEAFYNCSSLTSINIPDSVTYIGSKAFANSGLISIIIPDSVTSMGHSILSGCSGLTDVTIGSGVTTINNYTFQGCSGLTSIAIPDSVTSINWYAFYGCTGLSEITCNAITAPTIDNYAFQDIKSHGVLKVPAGSDYSSWMSTEAFCLGYYNWTIEYI